MVGGKGMECREKETKKCYKYASVAESIANDQWDDQQACEVRDTVYSCAASIFIL
uniref:DUF1540 domain-containing protein n=1 Tax=Loa loa TaxID=7209 RepID=A0A1I7VSA9_LOALO